MVSWSEAARSGETIECPPAGQTVQFLQTGADTDGELTRVAIELAVESTRENAVKHIHPHQEETITVQSGRMGVDVDGARDVLGPDESVTFEPGDAHAFWNAGEGPLRIQTELRPAMDSELFMRFAFGMSQVGWTTRSGVPLNPLRLGLLMDEFEGHLYIAHLPVPLQKLGAKVLAPIARVVGYSIDIDEGVHTADPSTEARAEPSSDR